MRMRVRPPAMVRGTSMPIRSEAVSRAARVAVLFAVFLAVVFFAVVDRVFVGIEAP
ncbi:MAG TPA: hypothetical protein VGO19_03475 [Actinomycetes bacterium]